MKSLLISSEKLQVMKQRHVGKTADNYDKKA
jgi:hypothetical protein